MKKITSILSALLAVALVFMVMPMAQAAQEVILQAGGVVQQSIYAKEDLGVLLASVHEGVYATRSVTNDWTGPTLNGNLTLFGGSANLRPGMTNGAKGSMPANLYKFVLINEYEKPIAYTYTHGAKAGSANVPMRYILYRSGVLTPVPAGGLEGTVPVGGYVEFELEWAWDYYVNGTQDLADTGLGVTAAAVGTEYEALLKFDIEADEPEHPARTVTLIWKDAVTGEVYDTWLVEPGMTVAQAMEKYGYKMPRPQKPGYTFQGFVDQDGVQITKDYVIAANTQGSIVVEVEGTWEEGCGCPKWLWPVLGIGGLGLGGLGLAGGLVIGGIAVTAGAAGLTIGGLTIQWLLALPVLPVVGIAAWLLHRGCDTPCGKPGCPACECGEDECVCNVNGTETKPGGTAKPGGYVPPPKTGGNGYIALLAGAFMTLNAGGIVVMLQRRKREAEMG